MSKPGSRAKAKKRDHSARRPSPPKPSEDIASRHSSGEPAGFPVVGIGASAGGLEAFTTLLAKLPRDTGMAFVLVQHLDPTHESMLPEILARSAPMPVSQVASGMPVAPNRIFVIPPNSRMALSDGSFQIVPRPRMRGREMPIDYFFNSLAETYKSSAVGVILSGTLSDGSIGISAIKAEGGVTFAQDERTAKYVDMPRAAIASGSVDFILSPEEIARELARIARHPELASARRKEMTGVAGDHSRIFQMLRSATGVDFKDYRMTTIRRRILRRMILNRVESLDQYVKFLKENRAEVQKLYEDILITVTGFFRDPESFKALKSTVFPELLKNRAADSPVRIWVPGCSTGEEVYSIAIALFECMAEMSANPPVQLFATDISERAIEKARAGIYLENALVDVSPDRMRRFFVRVDGGLQISKSIRDVCVFARQNVAVDPPFSNLDLVSCRNLLIYLEPALQKRIIPVFHYALKPGGYLMLGNSETLSTFPDLFFPMDRNNCIFTRRGGVSRPRVEFGLPRVGVDEEVRPGIRGAVRPGLDLQKEADRLVLARYAPVGVVVAQNMDVVQFRGRTSAFLEAAPGAPSLNVLKMAREGLLVDLREALNKSMKTGSRVRREGVQVRRDGASRTVNLEVVPVKGEESGAGHFLVLFEEPEHVAKNALPKWERQPREGQDAAAAKLEKELAATREYLQAIIEDHEASNEELKSANEEILSANEELQSTNEELETAKEELQSTNEELTTVNEELQTRATEITQANNDFANLLAGVNMPIVMVGRRGDVRRFTPAAGPVLNILPTDVGRPIGDIKPNIDVPNLAGLVSEVADTATPRDREVRATDGTWYLMRVRPYRTEDNRIDGAVVSFHDIDALKRSLDQMHQSRDYAEALVDSVREALVVLDHKLRVRTANQSFYELFRTTPLQTEGKELFASHGDRSVADLNERLRGAVERGEGLPEVELEIDFTGLGKRSLVVSTRALGLPRDSDSILLSIDDVTRKRIAEERLRNSEARYRHLFENARDGIWVRDGKTLSVVDVNASLLEMLGRDRKDVVGKRPWDLSAFEDAEEARTLFERMSAASHAIVPEITLVRPDGSRLIAEIVSTAYSTDGRTLIQSNFRDVTMRRRLEEELRQSQKLESIGRLAGGIAHDFNNILNIISAQASLLARSADDGEKRERGVAAIRTAVDRGSGVVRQLLTFARAAETVFEPVDVNAILEEVARLLGETFPKNVSLDLRLDSHVPKVAGDPNQLHQAFLNLCVNARDAMPEGGRVTVSTNVVEGTSLRSRLPDVRDEPYVCVEVADTGVGMNEETKKRLFEPFFTTKGTTGVRGLGLAVVYGIVNGHRGAVEVKSELGNGANIRIYLPIAESQANEKPKSPRKARRTENGGESASAAPKDRPNAAGRAAAGSDAILLVDDEPLLLDSMKGMLEGEGYRVLTAKSAAAAVALFEESPDDVRLVLCDLELPDFDGCEAVARMKRVRPDLNAILASGHADQKDRALRAGARDFFSKPYDVDALLRAALRAIRPAEG